LDWPGAVVAGNPGVNCVELRIEPAGRNGRIATGYKFHKTLPDSAFSPGGRPGKARFRGPDRTELGNDP
jgi:hypothetical protein